MNYKLAKKNYKNSKLLKLEIVPNKKIHKMIKVILILYLNK